MKHHYISLLAVGLSMLALLNGRAGGPDYRSIRDNSVPPPSSSYSGAGVIEAIDVSHENSPGIGRALVVGVVGNQLQRRHGGREIYTISVRMKDGLTQTVAQDSAGGLRIGDRARLDGGRVYRY